MADLYKRLGGHANDVLDVSLLVGAGLHVAGDVDHLAQERLVAHEAGVVRHVGGGDGGREEIGEVGAAADLLQMAAAVQDVGQGDQVDGLAAFEQGEHRIVDQVVGLVVKPAAVWSRWQDVSHVDHLLVVQQDGPEQRAFGLQRRWRGRVLGCWHGTTPRLVQQVVGGDPALDGLSPQVEVG
jgi:hypothetical protein